jgi:hypothetical protein
MPIHKCTTEDGETGFKYGNSGKCYKDREDALKQMRAIKWSESHSEKAQAQDDYALEILSEAAKLAQEAGLLKKPE